MAFTNQRTLKYIMSHQAEFKFCRTCCSFNLIGNEVCHQCGDDNSFEYELGGHIELEKDFKSTVQGLDLGQCWYTIK